MNQPEKMERILKPEDISLPAGYKIEVFAEKLTTPINLTFTDQGEMLIADAGITAGNGKVLMLTSGGTKVLAEGFKPPLTGMWYLENKMKCLFPTLGSLSHQERKYMLFRTQV